ncbi:MAG TPA: histidine kinase [Acidobacteriaceae bacterium]
MTELPGAALPSSEALGPRSSTGRAYWLCQFLGWGGYCLGYYLAVLVPFHDRGPKPILADLVYAVAGFFGTHLLRASMRAGGWTEMRPLRLVSRLFASALLVGALQTVTLDGTLWLQGVFSSAAPGAAQGIVLATFFSSALLIGFWLSIYFVVLSVRRRRSAEVDILRSQILVRESQLRSLQQQLNPHFLFNCLNSLRGMIDEDPRRAQEMVSELAGLLRAALRSDRCATIPLADELAAVDAYLRLESVRLEDRLRVHREVDPAATAAAIPPLLLQGLVENAVRHGIAPLRDGGDLTLRVALAGERLQICVTNSGALRAGSEGGIGLANARARLHLLYGGRVHLDLRESPPGTVQAALEIPFEPALVPTVPQEVPCEP